MVPVEVIEPESERERENCREQHRPREEDRSCAGRRGHGSAASRRFHENPRGPAVGRHRADPSRARDLSGCVRLLVDNDGSEPALLAVRVDELEPVRSGPANLPGDPVAEGIAADARAREDQVGVALDAVACPTVDVVAEQVDRRRRPPAQQDPGPGHARPRERKDLHLRRRTGRGQRGVRRRVRGRVRRDERRVGRRVRGRVRRDERCSSACSSACSSGRPRCSSACSSACSSGRPRCSSACSSACSSGRAAVFVGVFGRRRRRRALQRPEHGRRLPGRPGAAVRGSERPPSSHSSAESGCSR